MDLRIVIPYAVTIAILIFLGFAAFATWKKRTLKENLIAWAGFFALMTGFYVWHWLFPNSAPDWFDWQ